ncbi:COR1 [Candida oxycetoniae]|uniref:COR1 n=1 Tax=Candida oxycetoniae TaxID=497107 RepID=A0AAI9SW20_9ASCO|nr:COR1 [Candida oxycetoniae]KAI3404133.1 COR1 [Candida oxycetoniae]
MIRGSSIIKQVSKVSKVPKVFNCRFLSTGVKYTTLSNGITVASEVSDEAQHSTVGLYIAGGSRSEHPYCNGVSALTANLLSQQHNVGQDGVLTSSHNSREINGVVAETANNNVQVAGKLIAQIASNATEIVSKADFGIARKKLIKQAEIVETDPESKVLSHLAATAFQGYSLSLPTLGTTESVANLEVEDCLRHLEKHLVNNNVIIAAAGSFDHEKLVDAIESNLKIAQGAKPEIKPASFLGSEVRMRDDTMPKAYISIAVNGEGLGSPNYYLAKVAAAIYGNFNIHSTIAKYTSPKLASIVQEYKIVEKYHHFSKSWSDTGLWGFYAEIPDKFTVDDFCHFSLKEWNRLSISISEQEVARAKAQVKAKLASHYASTRHISKDIAKNILTVGFKHSLKEAFDKIDAITVGDVKEWGKSKVWDRDIVISGTGRIEDLLDYNRNRNEMAMMRW